MYKRFHIIFVLIMLFLSTIHSGCAGVFAKVYDPEPMLNDYRKESFKRAYKSADDFVRVSAQKQQQDFHFSLLERGKLALAQGDYNLAIKDLQQAEKKFLEIEGQISIREEIGSLFTNELGDEYEAEPYEKILISPYLALCYLAKGDFNGAKVERNRAILKINQYIEKTKKKHLENPFARYLSALIYEMEGKVEDAKIEYRKIAKRTKSLKYMKNEIKKLGKRTTDLVVFVDTGLAPAKYQVKYGPSVMSLSGVNVRVAIAYAKLRIIPSSVKQCRVFVDGEKKAKTLMLYDLEKTVMEQFKKTEEKQLQNIIKRLLLKQGIQIGLQKLAGKLKGKDNAFAKRLTSWLSMVIASIEKADLRRWSTLPKNIRFCRIRNVKHGTHTISIKYKKGRQSKKIRLKKGQINIVYFAVPK